MRLPAKPIARLWLVLFSIVRQESFAGSKSAPAQLVPLNGVIDVVQLFGFV